jgi:hypothetical protein
MGVLAIAQGWKSQIILHQELPSEKETDGEGDKALQEELLPLGRENACRQDGITKNFALSVTATILQLAIGQVVPLRGLQHLAQKFGMPHVIAIDEGNVFSLRQFDAKITSRAWTSVLRSTDKSETSILSYGCSCYLYTIVRAMIVHKEHFKVLKTLRLQTLDALSDVGSHLINWRYDANFHNVPMSVTY